MLPRYRFALITSIVMLNACQQAAWKAGASADDFKRDEQACRAQVQDATALKECLRGKGWTVSDFSAPADASAETIDDTTAAVKPATDSPVAAPLNESVSKTPASLGAATPNTDTRPSANAGPSTNASATAPIKHVPADPMQRQSVQTWWKAGAQASDFNIDAGICLDKLGESHAPDYKQHLYTRAMVGCLRERGWYAGTDPVYTPLR